jgi:hypothetical protein
VLRATHNGNCTVSGTMEAATPVTMRVA